jgi:ribonuclease BN (tRNA processing enzyme)
VPGSTSACRARNATGATPFTDTSVGSSHGRVTRVTFLGTGNFLAKGRYWNGFVLDERVLVEAAPTTLPHLWRSGIPLEQLDCIVISHFHPDHTFGWPFLLFALTECERDRPLFVVGPPGVERFFEEMMRLGSMAHVHRDAHQRYEIGYVEVDGSWQQAGPLRLRAVQVEHVPDLECFGYLFDRGDRIVGYSGDTHPCDGLEELAERADALVLECNGLHPSRSHMDVGAVRRLHERHPSTTLVLTHLGEGVDEVGLEGVVIPDDFETLEL